MYAIERNGLGIAAALAAASMPARSTLKGLTRAEFTELLSATA